MSNAEIDVRGLKRSENAVPDHVIDDLGHEKIRVEENRDYSWDCPDSQIYDMSKSLVGLDVGRLSDGVDFVKLIEHGQGGDVSYHLVHVAPLLSYIAEKVKK
jgi:hypothetical protein